MKNKTLKKLLTITVAVIITAVILSIIMLNAYWVPHVIKYENVYVWYSIKNIFMSNLMILMGISISILFALVIYILVKSIIIISKWIVDGLFGE